MKNFPKTHAAAHPHERRQNVKSTKSHTLLWLFLLPVMMVALISSIITLGSLHSQREQARLHTSLSDQDLTLLLATAELGQEMADLHLIATGSLHKAAEGDLDEAALYRIHSTLVDELAVMDEATRLLSERPEVMELDPEDARIMVEDFIEPR